MRHFVRVFVTRKTEKHHIMRQFCIGLIVLLAIASVEVFRSTCLLTASQYAVRSDKVIGAVRVVFLSDLHGREFGKDNARLLQRIAAERPDLIALVGDIFNSNADEDEIDRMCSFIGKAAEIAPVYYGLGNHEYGYLESHETDLLGCIRQTGVTVVNNDYSDVEINGTPIRIGGYMGYYRRPFMTTADPAQQESELAFADAFEDTDHFKLLLNHIPTGWLDWNYRDRYPVDLVLSGHYHGGLVRIPFLEQGVVAPYVGLFPPYSKGLFEGKEATCILTTGLAGSKLPRFFNPPEIAVVNILPAE